MKETLSRLDSPKKIRNFLTNTLEYDYDEPDIESKIFKGQNGIIQFGNYKNFNTYDNDDFRVKTYNEEDARWNLRNQIVEELITLKRLEKDEDINLTIGGACPLTELKKGKKAYLIIGLPASGKSSIANTIADSTGSLIIDSDYAKRKLPEFRQYEYGATLVHKESSMIVSSFKDKPKRYTNIHSLTDKAILCDYNVVLPKIGHSIKDIIDISDFYKKFDYEIHLVLIYLNRKEATKRAIKRFLDTDRYIPLELIYDEYANDPILNYYLLKNHLNSKFDSYGVITSNVVYPNPYRCVESIGSSPANIWDIISFEDCYS